MDKKRSRDRDDPGGSRAPRCSTVIVCSDQRFCLTLNSYLSALPGFEVIGVAKTGWEALLMVDDKNPGLVLADFKLDDMTGAGLSKALKGRATPPTVIVMSSHPSKDYMDIALKAGADGYVLKSEMDKLAEILRRIGANRKR